MSEETKVCTKCGEEKDRSDFYKDKQQSSGLKPSCKKCCNKKRQEWYGNNREEVDKKTYEWRKENWEDYKKTQKVWREDNKEHLKQYNEKYQEENREQIKDRDKQYRNLHQEYFNEQRRVRDQNNREHLNKVAREWRNNNREHVRKYDKNCYRPSRNTEKYRLRKTMKDLVKRSLMGSKSDTTENLLGYSTEKLKERLESQFTEGMSWDNRSEWHVDHIIPISYFHDKGEFRPHIINALSNLQPLWSQENLSKGYKHSDGENIDEF